ncbi:hypothetical protein PSHT_14722 [Puccinia striiformis]|uniref:Osmotin, thaumatin-like protein n=1 Tax=Puccinia striiformis TaxID=27350 RepID=A0A2S4UIP2_9BASI|nr:hypothetical protein PSHT_14722 [Puccinia striiformis]
MKHAFIVFTQLFLASYSILARSFLLLVTTAPLRSGLPILPTPTLPGSPVQSAGWEAQNTLTRAFKFPIAGQEGFGEGEIVNSPTAVRAPTGGCNGGLVCDHRTGSGVPPATLAEFKLNGDGGKDYYDVSNVDGSNLPVRITNNKGCPTPSCGKDLNRDCPNDRLKVRDGNGATIGCLSACQANLDGNHGNSANCCTGSHNTAPTCPKDRVQYYNYFKRKVVKVLSGLATNLQTTPSLSAPEHGSMMFRVQQSSTKRL